MTDIRLPHTWPFTGAQIVAGIQAIIARLEEGRRREREQAEKLIEDHARQDAEWNELPARKRGPRPSLEWHPLTGNHWVREAIDKRIAEVRAYSIDPERIFLLTIEDIEHFGLGVDPTPAAATEMHG